MSKPAYRYRHEQDRERKMRAFRDGDICRICGRPMRQGDRLDLGHFPGLAYGGPQETALCHAACNRRSGGQLGRQIQIAQQGRPRQQHTRRRARPTVPQAPITGEYDRW